ncbi:uncharacterized protein [Nicotiana tomentosiformis]|uniref:uncharacterized protein n=1 Tax=Nicotiana tomentosiformis TaxID=4098 RepID=UPI00051B038E
MTMQQAQHVQQMSRCCEICGESHMSDQCSVNPKSIYYVGQQNRGPTNQNVQYGNTYNPNWMNHPNFSWGGNQATQNQYRPQGNYNQPQKPPQQVEESTNDMLKKLLIDNQQLRTEIRNLERQIRHGKALEEFPHKKYVPKEVFERLVPQPEVEAEKKDVEHRQEIEVRPPPPFPQRLQKSKDESKYKKFLDILSQVRVNLPLIEVLQEVPKYAKYLRDIVANKRRLTEFETVVLTEECNTRVQSKLPPKLKDPGYFTIPLAIGKHEVSRAWE